MSGLASHLAILPIVIPLLVGATMILLTDQRRKTNAALGLLSALSMVAIAATLVVQADGAGADGLPASVYRLGDWPATFGIVLVVDRLSALMLVLVSILGLAALTFSLGRWQRAGAHFHPLVQFQLMGLNGAFLTGDLFNLFVFFEVMLAASYGLAMHGSGPARVRAGLHYIAINLAASLLFLIGASLAYGVAGTLNMADLAARIPTLAGPERMLLEVSAALLGIVFLLKAGMWPLGFWLPTTYAAAAPPAAALLSILSKVGLYAVLRLWLLLFGPDAGDSAGFGGTFLMAGGLITILFGTFAVLATQDMARLAGVSVLVSSGTLLAAIGAGIPAVTSGALLYLVSSVLSIAAFFLVVDLAERGRAIGADVLAVSQEAFGDGDDEDATEGEEIGIAIPASIAMLGLSFLACALLLSGLPPLSGFLAKFAILSPLLDQNGVGGAIPASAWLVTAALILSGLAMVLAMTRTGIGTFWSVGEDHPPRVAITEILPVAMLLLLCIGLTVMAGPAMRYMEATAQSLHAPDGYVRGVLPAAAPAEGRAP